MTFSASGYYPTPGAWAQPRTPPQLARQQPGMPKTRTGLAQTILNNQAAAENAQIDLQEIEDRAAEGRQRNDAATALAFSQARRNAPLGTGLAARRGATINEAMGGLAKSNAGQLAAARRKALNFQRGTKIHRTSDVINNAYA